MISPALFCGPHLLIQKFLGENGFGLFGHHVWYSNPHCTNAVKTMSAILTQQLIKLEKNLMNSQVLFAYLEKKGGV